MSQLFSKKNKEVFFAPLGVDNPVTVQVLVQYIQNGMGKSPQKEKRGNQNEGHKVLSAHQWYSFLFHNMIIPDNRCKAIDNCGCKDKQNSRSLPNIFLFAIVRSSFFSNFTAIIQC